MSSQVAGTPTSVDSSEMPTSSPPPSSLSGCLLEIKREATICSLFIKAIIFSTMGAYDCCRTSGYRSAAGRKGLSPSFPPFFFFSALLKKGTLNEHSTPQTLFVCVVAARLFLSRCVWSLLIGQSPLHPSPVLAQKENAVAPDLTRILEIKSGDFLADAFLSAIAAAPLVRLQRLCN